MKQYGPVKGKSKMAAVVIPIELHRVVKSQAALSSMTIAAAFIRGLELFVAEATKKNAAK